MILFIFRVGSALDPEDTPGLAHFLEHMLFMGTEKYPMNDTYREFIVNNGGYCNAFTFFTNTNYHFNVCNDSFVKALDIFSQFFICPLFDPNKVQDEMNAVNSENEKNQQSESWRFYQLFYNCAQQGSTFNRFIIGNKKTLDLPGIEAQLHEFYKKWYSANIMKLCVYSNKTLDEIEQTITEKFSHIENHQIQVPTFSFPINYPKSHLGKLIKMKTRANINEVNFIFCLDNYQKNQFKPLDYIMHFLGHEGGSSINSLGTCVNPSQKTL